MLLVHFLLSPKANRGLFKLPLLIIENDVLFRNDTAYSEKEIPSSPNRSRTYDLPITSSDALPLSYRRLVGAKAIKLGSSMHGTHDGSEN